MPTGKVKFFNAKKGYGFVADDESQKDIFVHASGLIDKIKEADHVSYEVITDDKGQKAINVRRS